MKKLFLFFLFVVSAMVAHAQAGDVIYKHWAFIGESATYLDVSYRVIKCGPGNEVQIQIFNENPADQVARFELEITNTADGMKFTKEVNFSIKGAAIVQGECSDDTRPALRISLPPGYDPLNLTVKLTFKP